MNNERWQEIWDVFFAALERAEGERAGWLASRAGADEELRREVAALLAGHEQGDSRLLKARELTLLADDVTQAAADALKDTLLGQQVGPYRIERVIGEGGMGTVYEAEQVVSVRRRVALKVIKLGMDTREIVRRFETERQALALMAQILPDVLVSDISMPGLDGYWLIQHIRAHTDSARETNSERPSVVNSWYSVMS